jgi:tRNA threonylcarbamoyladenosine biosynthesis protein TsaE
VPSSLLLAGLKKELIVKSLNELPLAAKSLLEFCGEYRVIAFYGAMGAGKTTFIKAICRELGISENVSSPTFALVNEYRDAKAEPVFHFDFYRIKNEQEAIDIGVDEYFYIGNYCFIEWPEKVLNLLPEDCVKVFINLEGETRIINVELRI